MNKKLYYIVLIFLILSLPFERLLTFELFNFTVKISYLVGFFLILISLPALIRSLLKNKLDFQEMSLFLFVALSLLSTVWSIDKTRSLVIALLYLFVAMIFLVIKRFSDNKTQKVCLEVIIYLGAILSVFALWQFISNSFGIFESLSFLRDEYKKGVFSFPRVQATFLEPLFFANFLIIPFFLSLRKTIEQKTVNLQHLYLFLISMAIVLTLSRGAFFAIIIGLGVFLGFYLLVYKHKIGKLVSPFLVLILSVLFSVGLIFVSSGKTGINSYLGQATNVVDVQGEDQVGSLEFLRTRNFTVKTALNHSRENLLGLGVGAFGSLPEFEPLRERGHQQTVNNEYLEILVEGGLASLILIVLFFLSSLLIAIRSFLKSKQLLDLVFLSVMVALLCQYLTFSNLYLIYFWVFWGLISSKKTTTQGSY